MTFIGAAAGYRLNLHMNVSYFADQLPARFRTLLDLVVQLLMALIAIGYRETAVQKPALILMGNEQAGLTGISHWVEHMNFKGTTNIPRDQVKGIIEQFGGSWNGYTWIDQTTYLETASKDALDQMLQRAHFAEQIDPPIRPARQRGACTQGHHDARTHRGYSRHPARVRGGREEGAHRHMRGNFRPEPRGGDPAPTPGSRRYA